MSGDHGSLAAPGRRNGKGRSGLPEGPGLPSADQPPRPHPDLPGISAAWAPAQVAVESWAGGCSAHSRAWEAEPRALGALAVFERGLDAPAVGVRQMDPPGGEAVLGRRPQTLERNCGPGEEVG